LIWEFGGFVDEGEEVVAIRNEAARGHFPREGEQEVFIDSAAVLGTKPEAKGADE
jgi:hypothetical protein